MGYYYFIFTLLFYILSGFYLKYCFKCVSFYVDHPDLIFLITMTKTNEETKPMKSPKKNTKHIYKQKGSKNWNALKAQLQHDKKVCTSSVSKKKNIQDQISQAVHVSSDSTIGMQAWFDECQDNTENIVEDTLVKSNSFVGLTKVSSILTCIYRYLARRKVVD